MKNLTIEEVQDQELTYVSKDGRDNLVDDLKSLGIEVGLHDNAYEIADNLRDWNYCVVDENDVDISCDYIVVKENV